MKNKIKLLLFIFTTSCLSAYSQLSEGGLPPSFNYQSNLRSTVVPTRSLSVDLDVERMLWEDEVSARNGSPLKIAEVIPVNIDMRTTGEWTTLPDSVKIWRQSVTVAEAQGLIISYDDFYIPEGGKLFIYDKDKTQILGAYTNKTHPEGGKFATELVFGDTFTLEYVSSSKDSKEDPRLVIESVGYVYNRDVVNGQKEPLINSPYTDINRKEQSYNCRININGVEGANWQKQKRGVVLYFIRLVNDWYACSGSLINNTNHDGTPYLLSAWHCFRNDPHFDTVIAYFNFEFPGAENLDITPDYQTLVGVTPLVQIPLEKGSDAFLVKLNSSIPESYKPYFNGWDRRNTPSQSGVIIHHPNYDVKKITTYNKTVTQGQYIGDFKGAPNAHWIVTYDGNSVTEGGSSGSPLFNQDGLIVGALTGGSSYCESVYSPDYYGKLWYSWDQFTDTSIPYDQSLKTYLDPSNKGIEVLGGYDPYDKTSSANGDSENIYEQKELVIFPNPVENDLNINTDGIIRKITIFNVQGRQVFSQVGYNASTTTIDASNLAKGVYTISIDTDSKKLSDKFIKK